MGLSLCLMPTPEAGDGAPPPPALWEGEDISKQKPGAVAKGKGSDFWRSK